MNIKLENIGTPYGGWTIPKNYLNEDSIVYCFGAGEDISFDIGVATKYQCSVKIFDPTPRAKQHYDSIIENVTNGNKASINNSDVYYNLSKEDLSLLEFIELGLWDKKETLKFYSPKNENHVSHSILNLQKTEKYFNADVDRLFSIMKSNSISKIDLLKIDIEGAEYKVLESIVNDNLDIGVICVEYDEFNCHLDNQYKNRIKDSIYNLKKNNYELINISGGTDYTFMKKELI